MQKLNNLEILYSLSSFNKVYALYALYALSLSLAHDDSGNFSVAWIVSDILKNPQG